MFAGLLPTDLGDANANSSTSSSDPLAGASVPDSGVL